MMRYLFCNVGWMARYQGLTQEDAIRGGGSFVDELAQGGEVCNFAAVDEMLYGYVKPPGEQIRIEKLGASREAESVNGVTVVWTALHPEGGTVIVGWYRNARVYRRFQTFRQAPELHRRSGVKGYWVSAAEADGYLLPESRRRKEVPRGERGGMGQANIWYGDTPGADRLIRSIEVFLGDVESTGVRESLRVRVDKADPPPEEPPPRRRRIQVRR